MLSLYNVSGFIYIGVYCGTFCQMFLHFDEYAEVSQENVVQSLDYNALHKVVGCDAAIITWWEKV